MKAICLGALFFATLSFSASAYEIYASCNGAGYVLHSTRAECERRGYGACENVSDCTSAWAPPASAERLDNCNWAHPTSYYERLSSGQLRQPAICTE